MFSAFSENDYLFVLSFFFPAFPFETGGKNHGKNEDMPMIEEVSIG